MIGQRVKINWGVFGGLTGTVIEAGVCAVLVEVNGYLVSLAAHDVEPVLHLVAEESPRHADADDDDDEEVV
jgi:hypothetical protein